MKSGESCTSNSMLSYPCHYLTHLNGQKYSHGLIETQGGQRILSCKNEKNQIQLSQSNNCSLPCLTGHQHLDQSSSHTKYIHTHPIPKGENSQILPNHDIKLKVHELQVTCASFYIRSACYSSLFRGPQYTQWDQNKIPAITSLAFGKGKHGRHIAVMGSKPF